MSFNVCMKYSMNFIKLVLLYFAGTTYFFKGKVFWEFDDFRMKVKKKSPALAAPYWLGCPMTENPYVLETSAPTSDCPVLRPPLLLLLLLLLLVDI